MCYINCNVERGRNSQELPPAIETKQGDLKMAATINQETCVGCGACVDSCPVSAIKIDADKAVITEGECIECGACVGSCPTEAISL